MKEVHRKLSDSEFALQFIECRLSPAEFTHEAHLRLAWIHIDRYGIEKALETIPAQLRNFVHAAGAADKYNATVTIGAIKAVYHFKLESTTDNFVGFIKENFRLKSGFKELIGSHYGFDIFNSQLAKKSYIAPVLLPFE